MKKAKRVLCVLVVIALLSTMSTAVLGVTLEFAEVFISVTKNGEKTSTSQIGDGPVVHLRGSADTVPYTLAASKASHALDTTGLNVTYSSQILTTYDEIDVFKRSVAVDISGNVVIPASSTTGTYVLMLSYTYGTATWEIEKDDVYIDSGYIAEAPMSMGIAALMQ